MGDIVMGVPAQLSGAILFFTSFALGYMIEDGFQALYKLIQGPEAQTGSRGKKVVGYLWVALWLGISSSVYMSPSSQLIPPHKLSMVPFSLSDRIGIVPVFGFTFISGLALLFGLKAEI